MVNIIIYHVVLLLIDFEIQTPQGLIHKIVNLASDAAVDRTCFEHLAEIKVEESAEIKLIVNQIYYIRELIEILDLQIP